MNAKQWRSLRHGHRSSASLSFEGRRSRMASRVVVLCGLLAGIPLAADPWADYVRACEAWDSRAASTVTCSALVERLSALASPEPEEHLALFKARSWLGDYSNGAYCDGARAIAEYSPDHPEVLLDLARCTDGAGRAERTVTLLVRALEIDPEHVDALAFLTRLVWYLDDDFGVEAATLARHRRTFYEVAERDDGKIDAAVYIHAAAVDVGDRKAAVAIRDRVRRDLGFDALDYGPEHWADSLQRRCGERLFELDLEDLCLSAIGTLVADAAAVGEAIPDDVLGHIDDALKLFHSTWRTGPKTDAAARLKAVLDAHPEPWRSSEHYRVYARTAPVWADRISSLRRAVDLDFGNLRARCELAEALALTGGRYEAWSVYMHMATASAGTPPCDPEKALHSVEDQALRGVDGALVDPDDPVKFMVLRSVVQ